MPHERNQPGFGSAPVCAPHRCVPDALGCGIANLASKLLPVPSEAEPAFHLGLAGIARVLLAYFQHRESQIQLYVATD
jgi:hypothetical protein